MRAVYVVVDDLVLAATGALKIRHLSTHLSITHRRTDSPPTLL